MVIQAGKFLVEFLRNCGFLFFFLLNNSKPEDRNGSQKLWFLVDKLVNVSGLQVPGGKY